MAIDYSTNEGKVRLRVGDAGDLQIFPSAVYTGALTDCSNNLPRTAKLVAQYILGALTAQTHQKLAQIEVFGGEWFDNYLAFVKATILNPNYMEYCPLPYTPITVDAWGNKIEVPFIQFQKDWEANYVGGTQSQALRWTAYPSYPGFGVPSGTYF
jgi:hypothetical protein